ncbi:hypothetical protein B0H13DRAFT_2512710, partial [Mycena leptocephala]
LCNKCGLFERTHSRPRPEQFPHNRGPLASSTPRSKPPQQAQATSQTPPHYPPPGSGRGSALILPAPASSAPTAAPQSFPVTSTQPSVETLGSVDALNVPLFDPSTSSASVDDAGQQSAAPPTKLQFLHLFRTNDSTAIRPEDVQFLENNVLAGDQSRQKIGWSRIMILLFSSPSDPSVSVALATMVSPDMPALAIFGSALDDRVLELAKTLSEVSTFAVMVRSAADDPLVKFNEIRRNMDFKAGPHSMADDDDKTDGESMSGDSASTDTEPEDDYDYRGEAGVFRLREVSRDLMGPILGENCLYDVIISSNSTVLSCVDLKVEARPVEIILDRSYSNLGFVVNRPRYIAGREYLARGFDPPSVKATRSQQKTQQTSRRSLLASPACIPHSRVQHHTVALMQKHYNWRMKRYGKELNIARSGVPSYRTVGKTWDRDGKFTRLNIRFGMGIEFYGRRSEPMGHRTGARYKQLPSISHILRNQIILWVLDPELNAKVRGVVALTTTYIADIKITEPLSIVEDEVVDLTLNRSHIGPPAVDTTALTPDAANSVAIGLFDENKDAIKRGIGRSCTNSRHPTGGPKTQLNRLASLRICGTRLGRHEQTMAKRNLAHFGPKLNEHSSSVAAWNLALTPNPMLQDENQFPRIRRQSFV